MASTNPELESVSAGPLPIWRSPARATLVLICGLWAIWLAAGSLGWIAPPLQRTLAWLALGAIVLLAQRDRAAANRWDGKRSLRFGSWVLAAAVVIAVLMTASSLTAVNILAVAVFLAALAIVRPGKIAEAAGPVALAATTLAVYRVVVDVNATGWALADSIGRTEGQWAALLTGRPLLIGASFGGIDFLVVMAALAVALRAHLAPRDARQAANRYEDKQHRAEQVQYVCQSAAARTKWFGVAALAIVAAQTAYLVVLACSHELAASLPTPARLVINDAVHMGVWTFSATVRTMLPWHLPVLAAIFQTVIAVLMFRLTPWPASAEIALDETASVTAEGRPRHRRDRRILGNGGENPDRVRPTIGWMTFGPAGLLLVAAASASLAPVTPDLAGRKIVAYDDGSLDWSTANSGNVPAGLAPRYGLLPALVASLGGQFAVSKNLTAGDLGDADVLIVLPPGTSPSPRNEMPAETRERIWSFVKSGGRLIVAGEPATRPSAADNALNELLEPTAMSFRDDTANSLTERWECNLLASPCAATAGSRAGRSSFSIDRAASVRIAWPAGPLLAGRWCWNELGGNPTRIESQSNPPRPVALPYSPGNRLGDLVLAAQQNIGRGTVIVLGDATCLTNDGIPFSYTFCGPLLAALAEKDTSPLVWWRQAVAIVAAGAGVVLLFRRYDPLRVAVAAIVLALAAIGCHAVNDATAQLLPGTASKGGTPARPVIYVDGSHLEAMGRDPWREDGVGSFTRVLAESGYLPLLAPDVSAARLKGAKMLVSIAPGREFSPSEVEEVNGFVEQGGVFLCTAGAPDVGPSRPLLEKFKLQIAEMPLPPWKNAPETEPLGAISHTFRVPPEIAAQPTEQNQSMRFHAAWLVSGDIGATLWPGDDSHDPPVIAGNRVGQGQAFLLGDTAFALQKGLLPPLDPSETQPPQNPLFWRTTLRRWLGR